MSLKIEERIATLVGESISCIRMYPLHSFWAIVLRLRVRSPCESNFPRANARSKGLVEGRLVFVIVASSAVSATGGVELTSLASMARVMCSVSSLTGMLEWNLVPSLVIGSAKPSCGISLLLNPSSNRFPLNGDSMGSAGG